MVAVSQINADVTETPVFHRLSPHVVQYSGLVLFFVFCLLLFLFFSLRLFSSILSTSITPFFFIDKKFTLSYFTSSEVLWRIIRNILYSRQSITTKFSDEQAYQGKYHQVAPSYKLFTLLPPLTLFEQLWSKKAVMPIYRVSQKIHFLN